jgi:hypothetical protein
MPFTLKPEAHPEISDDLAHLAARTNQHVVQVICEDPYDRRGTTTFVAAMAFLPREGEHILLEDKRTCVVKQVAYSVVSVPASDFAKVSQLRPHVWAEVMHGPPQRGLGHV